MKHMKHMKKMILGGIAVAVIAILAIWGCRYWSMESTDRKGPAVLKKANPQMAEFLQENLVEAQRLYSVRNGGGGKKNFTGNPQNLTSFASTDALYAISGFREQTVPADGYVVELREFPVGDAFRTDFEFVVKPAPGFEGQTFTATKQYKNKK